MELINIISSELVSGASSGFAQTIVGHPLETLKVWIQSNQTIYNSKGYNRVQYIKNAPTINSLINKLYIFPYRSLYRGIIFPLATNSFIGSLLFINYKKFQGWQNNNDTKREIIGGNDKLINNNSIFVNFTSGVYSGVIASPFIYYITLFKLFKQVNERISFDKIVRHNGLMTTILREGLAFGIYFSSYEYCYKVLGLNSFVSGGLSGMINWSITYPIDTLRNRQIIYDCSLYDAALKSNLYKGCLIAISRAIIVNGVGFYTYEETRKFFEQYEKKHKEHKQNL